MSLCVPDWVVNNGEIEVFSPPDPFFLGKGRLDQRAPAKANHSSFATVPSHHEPNELILLERTFTMQSRDGRGGNQSSWTQGISAWVTDSAIGLGGLSSKVDPVNKDGTLDAIVHDSVLAVDVPVSSLPFQDDEMISWLQYPLEDSLDRSYCSDLFGDLPNSNVQVTKTSFHQLNLKSYDASLNAAGSPIRGILPQTTGILGNGNRSTTLSQNAGTTTGSCGSDACGAENRGAGAGADAAMARGAGRAAGLIFQSGAEAFNKVRTTMQQPSSVKGSHSNDTIVNSKILNVLPYVSHPLNQTSISRQNPLGAFTATTSMQTLKPMDVATFFNTPPPPQGKSGTMNFSHFSRPVAETKANLHLVGVGSGPTNIERVRQQFGKSGREEVAAIESSIEGSTSTVSGMGSCKARDLQVQLGEAIQCISTQQRWLLPLNPLPPQEADTGKGRKVQQDNIFNLSMSGSAVTASEKGVETLETAEQTATSPSRGSGNSTEKSGKEADTSSKRKFSVGEESEYQSEDVEELAANNKKPPLGRSGIVKRSRAAEIHNQSERRRRDRINEKMKALQELIPNVNKTDKASMLDEAIEYLKLLQSQLQTMSMRTGIGIPPSMIPMGMQHMHMQQMQMQQMQMQQMPALPHMGLGMGMGMGVGLGMGMGMGMGLMDMGAAAAGRTVVPLQSLPGQPPPGPPCHTTGFQPGTSSLGMAEAHDCLQNSGIVEPYNVYLAHQQLQPAPLNMNMNMNMHMNVDMYNAFMLQQQQHQQQQWQQHLQQSQQSQGNNGSKPMQ